MAEGDTGINALIGGVVSIVLAAFVPMVPILGGAVSGYLQGGTSRDGVKVGAIAGFVAWIPFALVMALAVTILQAIDFRIPIPGPEGMILGFVGDGLGMALIAVGLVLGLVYFVGFSALGGWIGNYVKTETDIDI